MENQPDTPPDEQAPAPVEAPVKVPAAIFRAKVDHDGVYWGVEKVDALAPGDLEVPHDCDCRPGAYKLMPAVGEECAYLEPIIPQNIKTAPAAPTLEQAFYALLAEGPDAPRVVAWREAFKQTIDGGN